MITDDELDRCFQALKAAAIAGERCPLNGRKADGDAVTSKRVCTLAETGWIRVEIYAHNWRVVTILKGPHRGKRTAPRWGGGEPWKVIDENGLRTNTSVQRRVDAAAAVQALEV